MAACTAALPPPPAAPPRALAAAGALAPASHTPYHHCTDSSHHTVIPVSHKLQRHNRVSKSTSEQDVVGTSRSHSRSDARALVHAQRWRVTRTLPTASSGCLLRASSLLGGRSRCGSRRLQRCWRLRSCSGGRAGSLACRTDIRIGVQVGRCARLRSRTWRKETYTTLISSIASNSIYAKTHMQQYHPILPYSIYFALEANRKQCLKHWFPRGPHHCWRGSLARAAAGSCGRHPRQPPSLSRQIVRSVPPALQPPCNNIHLVALTMETRTS